jgi:hypothetical protein
MADFHPKPTLRAIFEIGFLQAPKKKGGAEEPPFSFALKR